MVATMRGMKIALLAAVAVGITACGGDESERNADSSRTITSDFLATFEARGGGEAITPGDGGFIETPRARARKRDRGRDRIDELGEAVPEITRAPGSGESVFKGVLRDIYLRARTACGGVPVRTLAGKAGVSTTSPVIAAGVYAGVYASRYDPRVWRAAFEGCAVGALSR
jgi:hypothetical protein